MSSSENNEGEGNGQGQEGEGLFDPDPELMDYVENGADPEADQSQEADESTSKEEN